MTTAIEPTTAAASVTVNITDVPARVVATGLAGAETITVKTVDGVDEIEQVAYDDNDTAVVLTATKTPIPIRVPGLYLFEKGVTAGAVGLFVTQS